MIFTPLFKGELKFVAGTLSEYGNNIAIKSNMSSPKERQYLEENVNYNISLCIPRLTF